MTASISVKDGSLLVDIEGADQLWALKSQLQIPVKSSYAASATPSWWSKSTTLRNGSGRSRRYAPVRKVGGRLIGSRNPPE